MEPVSAESLLPIEVWGKIFQHSAAKDAWNFRLVCSEWKGELDKHFDKWTVRLDQNSPYFQNILQLKVKEATIVDLKSPVDFGQEETPRLFKHPDLLEKLTINEWSRISLQNNMMPLLKSCRKTIKHLQLSVGCVDDDEIFDPAINLYATGLEFTNLESLALLYSSCTTQLIKELALFNVIFGLSTMSKIKSLRVSLSSLHTNALFSEILAFIGKTGTNLEEFECHLDQAWAPTPADEVPAQAQFPANFIDLDLLRQVRGLQKIDIEYEDIDFNDNFQIPCQTLLEAQINLTNLHLQGIYISRQSLRSVCYNNQNTLKKIELDGLDFNIDLAIIAGCMHLKELVFEGSQEGLVLLNSRSLPVGIQKFKSRNYLIDSKDILKLFTGHGELVNIILQNSGFYGPYGVTAAVFAALVINRNLSNKLTSVDISGFNCSTAGDLAALNDILRGLMEHPWEDRQDFQNERILFQVTIDEGGEW